MDRDNRDALLVATAITSNPVVVSVKWQHDKIQNPVGEVPSGEHTNPVDGEGRLASLGMGCPSAWVPGLCEMCQGDLHTSLWMRLDQQLLPLYLEL